MFKNLKIGVRLGLGFGIVLALLLIISITSISRIAALNESTQLIVDDRMPKIEMASEIQENTLVMGRALRNLILSNDKNFEKTQLDTINNSRKRNGEILDKLRPLIQTPKGKAAMEKVNEARAKYNTALETLLPLAQSTSPKYNQEKPLPSCSPI